MHKLELVDFGTLGTNMQMKMKENAIAILEGGCNPVAYKDGDKDITLVFELKDSEVIVTKTITIDFQEQSPTFHAITEEQMKEIATQTYGKAAVEAISKVYTIAELQNLKAITKMCEGSEKFNEQFQKLLKTNDHELQKTISMEVAEYKRDPQNWFLTANKVQWNRKTTNPTHVETEMELAETA